MKYCCKYDTVLVQGMAKKETKKTYLALLRYPWIM